MRISDRQVSQTLPMFFGNTAQGIRTVLCVSKKEEGLILKGFPEEELYFP